MHHKILSERFFVYLEVSCMSFTVRTHEARAAQTQAVKRPLLSSQDRKGASWQCGLVVISHSPSGLRWRR